MLSGELALGRLASAPSPGMFKKAMSGLKYFYKGLFFINRPTQLKLD